jgi:hypothetical protein
VVEGSNRPDPGSRGAAAARCGGGVRVVMIEYLGWAATAVFVGSYLCKRADALKRVQMLGALMWVAYGLMIQATPVVAANLLVFGAAGWALFGRPVDVGQTGDPGQ